MPVEDGKYLFTANELHYNHYSYGDIPSRFKEYNVAHKYCLLRYNFRETGVREYTKIYTSNSLTLMQKKVREAGIWEDHTTGVKYFKGRFGFL